MALFEQQDAAPFVDDAHEQLQAFRRLMPSVLLALSPRRDEITLIPQEAGETTRSRSLAPAADRGRSPAWLGGRGPPLRDQQEQRPQHANGTTSSLNAEALRKALTEPQRNFQEVLLSVSGTNAGVFLALEAGRTASVSTEKEEPVLLTIRPVAMSPSLPRRSSRCPSSLLRRT